MGPYNKRMDTSRVHRLSGLSSSQFSAERLNYKKGIFVKTMHSFRVSRMNYSAHSTPC